jgi:TorA maturation chaperone TorD
MDAYQGSPYQSDLAEVYSCLADVLLPTDQVGLPDWIALPGREWPIYEVCIRIAKAQNNPQLDLSARALSGVPDSSLERRFNEYETLFIGNGRPPIWLYESHYIDGRIFGPTSCSVRNIYKDAGLEFDSVELADHAGLELAFLAYLVEMEKNDIKFSNKWKQARELFSKNHVGVWLPLVGKQLSRSSDPAWRSIGIIIAALFTPDLQSNQKQNLVPIIAEPDMCTLCGLCTQMCPTKALTIQEDNNSTTLELEIALCKPCSKCIMICPKNVLLLETNQSNKTRLILRESPRAVCSECGSPTFSQAELDYTGGLLGNPDWLSYCLSCRTEKLN